MPASVSADGRIGGTLAVAIIGWSPMPTTPQLTLPDGAERARIQKRTLTVVVASQVLGGAGLAAGVTVGALLAQEMLGSEGLAGIPTALFTLGAALTAFLVGRTTHRWGRRTGLGLGFCAGGLGAIGVPGRSRPPSCLVKRRRRPRHRWPWAPTSARP
jgi:hypothetical protein